MASMGKMCCALFVATVVVGVRVDDELGGSQQAVHPHHHHAQHAKSPRVSGLAQESDVSAPSRDLTAPSLKSGKSKTSQKQALVDQATKDRVIADRTAMETAVKATAMKSKMTKADAANIKAQENYLRAMKAATKKQKVALDARLKAQASVLPWRQAMQASAEASAKLHQASAMLEESTTKLAVGSRIAAQRMGSAEAATERATVASNLQKKAKSAMDDAYEDLKEKSATLNTVAREERTAAEKAKELTVETVIAKKDREEKWEAQQQAMAHNHAGKGTALKAERDLVVMNHVATSATTQVKLAMAKVQMATSANFHDIMDGTLETQQQKLQQLQQRMKQ